MKKYQIQTLLTSIFLVLGACDGFDDLENQSQEIDNIVSVITDSKALNSQQNNSPENHSSEIDENALESDGAPKKTPAYYPGIDVDIRILKDVTSDYKNIIVEFLQLGTDNKVVSEPIVNGSDCRSFGFPVLLHDYGTDEKGVADSFFLRNPELDVDTSCRLIDYSASKASGSGSFLVYNKDVPDYDPAVKPEK